MSTSRLRTIPLLSLGARLCEAMIGLGILFLVPVPGWTVESAGAVEPTATTANVPNRMDVSIEGVLLDTAGNPVNEGFLMLENNPQINTLTCGDGRFRLQGVAIGIPDIILSSAAGSATGRSAITTGRLNHLVIRMPPGDPDFITIEMGMALKVRWTSFYASLRPLSKAQKACRIALEDFLSAKGNGIITRMLAAKPLTDDEKRFEYLLASEIWCRTLPWPDARMVLMTTSYADYDKTPYARFLNEAKARFDVVSAKAVRREHLTTVDIHDLRIWNAMFGSTGFDPADTDFTHQCGAPISGASIGQKLPFDISFVASSPLYTAPGWSDYTSLSATEHLRLEGIHRILDSYWKWQIKDGCMVESPSSEWKQHYWQDWFHITSIDGLIKAGKGKPLYLLCSNFEDGTHPGWYTRELQYVRNAYRDVAQVMHTSQTSATAFWDMYIDEWTHYGPNPKANPLHGLDCARWEDDNFTPMRHARTDKLLAMNFPWVSGEILLDLTRGSSPLCNHFSQHMNILFDGDGKVALAFPGGGWTTLHDLVFSSSHASNSYQRQGGDCYALSLIHEQLLRGMIANGGHFDAKLYDAIMVQYPRTFLAKDDVFLVKSIDTAKRLIVAGWVSPGGPEARDFYCGPNLGSTMAIGNFTFAIKPDTRFEVRCLGNRPTWSATNSEDLYPVGSTLRMGSLDDFAPGDRFLATIDLPTPIFTDVPLSTVMAGKHTQRPAVFDMAALDGKELTAEGILNYSHLCYSGGMDRHFTPMYARVVAMDGPVMSVKIAQDEVREMWGYRFWKAEEGTSRARANDIAAQNWAIIKRWGDGTDDDRSYRFKLDGATDVYRNGLIADAGSIAVGDYVFVEYESWWETQHQQHDIICPDRVQASAPMTSSTP